MQRLLAGMAVAAVLSQTGPVAQRPAEPSRAPLTVDFVALDRDGSPVLDLTPREVEVWIGHFRAPIASFTAVTPETDERGGRLFVLVLDEVTVPLPFMARVKEVARRFVTRMAFGDRMAIVTLDGSAMEATDDRARLMHAIDSYSVRAAGFARLDTLGRHLLTTIAELARQTVEAPGRRKTIVGIGSGWLFDRPIPAPVTGQDMLPEWVDAMRSLAFAHANLYVIDPIGMGGGPVDGGESGFARATGGRAFLNTNSLLNAADRVLRESANYYVVEVPDPPVGDKADLRPLEVKSLRRGVTIRARQAIPGRL